MTRPVDPRVVWTIQSLLLCMRGAVVQDKSTASGLSALHIICWCESVWRRRGNKHQQMTVHVATMAESQEDDAPGNHGRELRPLRHKERAKGKHCPRFRSYSNPSSLRSNSSHSSCLDEVNAHLKEATQAVQGPECFFFLFTFKFSVQMWDIYIFSSHSSRPLLFKSTLNHAAYT